MATGDQQFKTMKKLTMMIPGYRELNRIYTGILSIEGAPFSFDQQRILKDFYENYKNTKEFETEIIALLLENTVEKCNILLRSLLVEIEKNISLYKKNQPLFDNYNLQRVCFAYADSVNPELKKQMDVCNTYYKELIEAEGSLEARCFCNQTNMALVQEAEERHEKCKKQYEEQKKILDDLYARKEEKKNEAFRYLVNHFNDMYKLGCEFRTILRKYLTTPIENPHEKLASVSAENKDRTYFDMTLLSQVHEICNNEEFENISQLDFYSSLNLKPSQSPLKIKSMAKTRVCYLIYLLSEKLPKDLREEWREQIVELLEIDPAYYRSKYKEPVSSFPSNINRDFAHEMQKIFK